MERDLRSRGPGCTIKRARPSGQQSTVGQTQDRPKSRGLARPVPGENLISSTQVPFIALTRLRKAIVRLVIVHLDHSLPVYRQFYRLRERGFLLCLRVRSLSYATCHTPVSRTWDQERIRARHCSFCCFYPDHPLRQSACFFFFFFCKTHSTLREFLTFQT